MLCFIVCRDLQNRTGHRKTDPNRHRRWPKTSPSEGFGSVLVFASGETEKFLFQFWEAEKRRGSVGNIAGGEKFVLPHREGGREGGRERKGERAREGWGEGERERGRE